MGLLDRETSSPGGSECTEVVNHHPKGFSCINKLIEFPFQHSEVSNSTLELWELSTERLGDLLSVTQPVRVELPIPQWERGLDLRDFGKLMVAPALPLEKLSEDKRMVGTEQGHLGTLVG